MNKFNNKNQKNDSSIVAGIVLAAIGIFWLLGEMNIQLPRIFFQPYTFLIGIGVFLGIRKQFGAPYAWSVPLIIGAMWLVADLFNVDVWRFGFPAALIGMGAYIIFNSIQNKKNIEQNIPSNFDQESVPVTTLEEDTQNPYLVYDPVASTEKPKESSHSNFSSSNNQTNAKDFELDSVDINGILSGNKRTVISKNFKGGTITAVLGGVDINLLNADMQSPAVLDVTVLMGGVKIIVPAGWEVKNNVTTILGGVEERRQYIQTDASDKKVLILKGTTILGGIDVRSY
jgi:predicted membrane protein